jgi:hypothetical protein
MILILLLKGGGEMAGGLVHTVFKCISYDWRVSVREKGQKPISRNMFRFANFLLFNFFSFNILKRLWSSGLKSEKLC